MGPRAAVPRVLRRRLAVGARVLTALDDARRRLTARFGRAEIDRWWAGLPERLDRLDWMFGHRVLRGLPFAEALERGGRAARALAAEPAPAVLLHGDLHPGNVLDGGPARGLVAIDPRPCVGDPAFDGVDWVFHRVGPHGWAARSRALTAALGCDPDRLWRWCVAFAPMLASARPDADDAEALLALGP